MGVERVRLRNLSNSGICLPPPPALSWLSGVASEQNTPDGVLENPCRKQVMNVTLTCFSKNCGKPRFLEYYVCVEHFVCYAAPRYAESIALKAKPITYSAIPAFPSEATSGSSGQPEHAARKSAKV
jgi:hypothetical protein